MVSEQEYALWGGGQMVQNSKPLGRGRAAEILSQLSSPSIPIVFSVTVQRNNSNHRQIIAASTQTPFHIATGSWGWVGGWRCMDPKVVVKKAISSFEDIDGWKFFAWHVSTLFRFSKGSGRCRHVPPTTNKLCSNPRILLNKARGGMTQERTCR